MRTLENIEPLRIQEQFLIQACPLWCKKLIKQSMVYKCVNMDKKTFILLYKALVRHCMWSIQTLFHSHTKMMCQKFKD